jgi:hypothetical protein
MNKITIGIGIKKKYTIILMYRPNGSRRLEPDATNLYGITNISNGLGTNRIENKVKFDNNIKESISWF